MGRSSKKRVSVCARPRDVPATVHCARFDEVDAWNEITSVVYEALARKGLRGRGRSLQAAVLIGEIRAQLKSFAEGRLPEGRDAAFEAVVSQPDLWEIRVDNQRFGKFRMYHAEPSGGDPDIVVLRFHQKAPSDLASNEVIVEQNRIMEEAQLAYEVGAPSLWGLSLIHI